MRPRLEANMLRRGFQWGAPIFIRIFKESKTLEVWLQAGECYQRYKTYYVCSYGKQGLGPKLFQGDGRAPEGFYVVSAEQMNPRSQFHLSFNLGYPNAYDSCHGRSGNALMVHGSCVSSGCFAMTDWAMEEIYTLADAALANGQPNFPVHIFPFEMTPSRLKNFRLSPWYDFWENLLEGYTWFSQHGCPPDVQVHAGRYVFCSSNDRIPQL